MDPLLEKKVSVPEHVLFREIEGELVILDLETERYFGLDDVGARMWAVLTGTGTGEKTLAVLGEEYDADPGTLRDDLVALMQQLVDRSLLILHEH